jgi:hypothetical protein
MAKSSQATYATEQCEQSESSPLDSCSHSPNDRLLFLSIWRAKLTCRILFTYASSDQLDAVRSAATICFDITDIVLDKYFSSQIMSKFYVF